VTARGFLFINESNRLAQADRYRDNNTDNKNCLRRYGLAQKLNHILSAKCPVISGLLQIDYVKLFLNDP
jgi:hypothetical protein